MEAEAVGMLEAEVAIAVNHALTHMSRDDVVAELRRIANLWEGAPQSDLGGRG